MSLRPRQEAMLDMIEEFIEEHGYPPTVRDIQAACQISSTSVVDYNLRILEREGLIRRSREVSRGIELVGRRPGVARVPLLGAIAAGEPLPVFPQEAAAVSAEDTVEVDQALVRGRDGVYALQVKGESMIDALVRDGDIVILERAERAESGDMVAAWLISREEATLKRFFSEGSRVRLQPENRSMAPIYADARDVQIHGRVIGVIRRYG